jgi:PIN domain nuclease of toxin-antitoxin system
VQARRLLADPHNERYVSVVSSWEITIKYGLQRVILKDHPDRFISQHRAKLAADILPLDEDSVFHLTRLPSVHSDPFDRMLICQAMVHGMILVTPDQNIAKYPVRTVW